jgi:hypothetical protein
VVNHYAGQLAISDLWGGVAQYRSNRKHSNTKNSRQKHQQPKLHSDWNPHPITAIN